MKIACFGDSLTFGSVGYSYVKYLSSEHVVINKGVNGDTTICLYERMKKYIENPVHNDVDVYVIAIGTNDLLLPYLSTISLLWKIQITPRVKIKKCISEDILFEKEYKKLIELILSHNKIVVMVGLPLIQLKGYPNESVHKRNLIMKNLANSYQVSFIDPAFLQRQAFQNMSFTYTWKYKNVIRIMDGIIMLVLPFSKDWFSKFRHLELTVDGVHFNSRAAELIGNAINYSITSTYSS